MSFLSRLTRRGKRTPERQATVAGATHHLMEFCASRVGVEAFVEPPTTLVTPSLLLVAADGEWTRRSVDSAKWARQFAKEQQIPCYDAPVIGYPQRMRDFNARAKRTKS